MQEMYWGDSQGQDLVGVREVGWAEGMLSYDKLRHVGSTGTGMAGPLKLL